MTFDFEIEPDALTWTERLAADRSLRAFIDAEIERAGVDAGAWRAEAAHWQAVARDLQQRLVDVTTAEDRRREAGRERQIAHRRRRQFLAAFVDGATCAER